MALEKNAESLKIIPKEIFNLDIKIYKHLIQVKNMLGGFSSCNLLIRKKHSDKLFIVIEESNGDELEIELSKIVRLQRIKNLSCVLIYKTIFQRKISFDIKNEQTRLKLFENMKKTYQSIGIKSEQIQSLIMTS